MLHRYLVVVAVRDGVGVNSSLLHLKQDSDGQDRLAILATQLHQHPVTHLYTREGQEPKRTKAPLLE